MAKNRLGKILFLPGWTYDASKNQALIDDLRERGLEVELLPVPGLTGQELERVWTLEDYRQWLEEKVADEQGALVLLGHSNGGRIILKYLSSGIASEKVKRVVLIDSAGLVDHRWRKVCKRVVGKSLAKLGGGLKQCEPLRRWFYRLLREKDYQEASPVMRQTMSNLLAEDLRAGLGKIKQPALIIWGQNDQVTPLYLGQELAEKLPRAKLKVIVGARHTPQATATTTVALAIREFLERADGEV